MVPSSATANQCEHQLLFALAGPAVRTGIAQGAIDRPHRHAFLAKLQADTAHPILGPRGAPCDPGPRECQIVEESVRREPIDDGLDRCFRHPTLGEPLANFGGASGPAGEETKGPLAGSQVSVARHQAYQYSGINGSSRLQPVPRHLLDVDAQPAAVVEHNQPPLTVSAGTARPSLRTLRS